jgi:4-hydroxythreonine-4-phosphate dehydrogenase
MSMAQGNQSNTDEFADEDYADEDTALYEFPMPLVITSGDPCGVGPEVTHKAVRRLLEDGRLLLERPVTVIGDAYLYARHLAAPSEMHPYNIIPVEDFIGDPGYLMEKFTPTAGTPWRPIFLDCGFKDESNLPIGVPSVIGGERALTYLDAAIELLVDEFSETVVTAPICKDAMDDELFPYPGQTEYFAEACDVKHPVMMLVGGGLRVALATIHEPLSRVSKLLTRDRVRGTIRRLHTSLVEDFGIKNPRLAICGLNPHAGEGGRFGKEDIEVIQPVVENLRQEGLNVEGPLAADSVFAHAREGRYDGVVAMYHDQGLIPVKTLAFHEGVNVTLGLPIVRTSPDHGTAFDIAGQNKADGGAMYTAIMLAEEIAKRRDELYE